MNTAVGRSRRSVGTAGGGDKRRELMDNNGKQIASALHK
jgi:hypothetical protein